VEAKLAATSQAHDEARHFTVMHDYLAHLGPVPKGLGPRTTRVLVGTLQANTLTKKLVGMQMMIEPMALALFHLVRESRVEPVLCDLVGYYERDEARHVALGVLHLPRLLRAMTVAETADLYRWEFGEYWAQLAMLRELDRPNVGLCLDAPLFKERQSDAYVTEAARVCGDQVLLTHYGAWNFVEGERGVEQGPCPSFGGPVNYAPFLAELQRAGYEGYLVSEYCLPCIKDHRLGGVDDIDRATAMALGYMKRMVMAPQSV
jgi:hypothetical protein